jgi:2-oxoisovalerate dehydrogenase E1 component
LGSILEAAADLLGVGVEWVSPTVLPPGCHVVPVIGSSPSDINVEVVDIPVEVGMNVGEGQLIASVEADKAVVDIDSPAAGIVVEIHVRAGQKALVGSPLLTLASAHARPVRTAPVPAPLIVRPTPRVSSAIAERFRPAAVNVYMAGLASVRGSRRLANSELASRLAGLGPDTAGEDGIFSRTGIESRLVAGPDQNVVSMATEAARQALREARVRPEDLALVICSTSTPSMVSPSTASLVMHALAPEADIPAYDLSAACSGYLYALANAWDFLQQRAEARVLVLTSEVMRSVVDIDDPATSPLFGDAATGTVLTGGGEQLGLATLRRPLLGGLGDDGSTLSVPLPHPGAKVRMDGRAVFSEAVRRMSSILERACMQAAIPVSNLSLVVPHQANGRILDALRKRLRLRDDQVWNEIRWQGNTSSSSIPLALDTVLRADRCHGNIGLCAFGAGLTFGATLLRCD